jgi:lipoate synthase
VVDDLPFSSVESSDFRNMINILRNGAPIPSADTIKKNIMVTFGENKKKIRQLLQVIIILKFYI